LKEHSSIFVHCSTQRLEAKSNATWTSFTETTYCQCNNYNQYDRECKNDDEFVNQFWCDSKDMSPIKRQRCETCLTWQESDYAYNENYYELNGEASYDYSSYYQSKRSVKAKKTCGAEHFEVDFGRYCPCEIPVEHRPENCHSPCHGISDVPEAYVELGSSSEILARTAGVGKLVLLGVLGACFVGCLVIFWCKHEKSKKSLKREEEPMVRGNTEYAEYAEQVKK